MVIHVLNGDLHAAEPTPEEIRQEISGVLAAVHMRPPADVDVSNIVDAFPVFLLDEMSHPRAVAARRAAEHAVHGLLACRLAVLPRRLQCGRVLLHMLSDIVLLKGFRQFRYHLHGFLQPFHRDVQRIAEQAADPRSHVDPGPPERF